MLLFLVAPWREHLRLGTSLSFRSPQSFELDLEALEAVECATLRFVAQGVHDLLDDVTIAQFERLAMTAGEKAGDKVNYLGEDLTRMALDRIGFPRVPDGRLFGAIDYKLAAYQFLPDFAVRQALFVDSKVEKNALNVARVQVTQTSLDIRQRLRNGDGINVPGHIPSVWETESGDLLTTTIFVKYHYGLQGGALVLRRVSVVALPNGFLQDQYNPSSDDGIWNIGPNSPARGERFRTRLNFTLLCAKASWRVQRLVPGQPWTFAE